MSEVIDLAGYREQKRPPSSLAAMAVEIRAEDEHAAALCSHILTGPSAAWLRRLREAHGTETLGMVRHLLDRGRALLKKFRLADALQVTGMALMVAGKLDPERYTNFVIGFQRAVALREYAYLQLRLGRLREALVYAERSERAFAVNEGRELDGACVALMRIVALRKLNQITSAASLARKAAQVFAWAFDRQRYVMARRLQAAALYDGGAVERALEILRFVEPGREPAREDEACLARDLEACFEFGEDFSETEMAPMMPAEWTEPARIAWHLARTLADLGYDGVAMDRLSESWHNLTALGMKTEGALAALDFAELLADDWQLDEIAAICDAVVADLPEPLLGTRGLAALSLLRKAAVLRLASPELVRAVQGVVWRCCMEAEAGSRERR